MREVWQRIGCEFFLFFLSLLLGVWEIDPKGSYSHVSIFCWHLYIYVEWSEKVQEPLAKKQGGGGGLFNPSDSSASFGSAELRMQALPSHSCYMKSEDVAAFVQSKTTLLAVAKAANSSLAKTLT